MTQTTQSHNTVFFADGEYNILAPDGAPGSNGIHTNALLDSLNLYLYVTIDTLKVMDASQSPAVPATTDQVANYISLVQQQGIIGLMFPGATIISYLQAFVVGPIIAEATPGAPGPGVLP